MMRSLWFEGVRDVALRQSSIPQPAENQLQVRTICSAISAGTEMLIYRGEVPTDLAADATIDALAGELAFPLQYGYACVGEVMAVGAGTDRAWVGRRIFAFNPHEEWFVISAENAIPLPDNLPSDIAALLPNMETAVSFVMDGRPIIGERVILFGLGVVGLLTTKLLADLSLAELSVADRLENRLALAATFGGQSRHGANYDLAYELTGNPAALNDAIEAVGYGGRVVIGSWYGVKQAQLDLGGTFHRNHIQLISSQVSTLHPRWRGRWTKTRRLQLALDLLQKHQPHQLITHHIPVTDAATAYQLLDEQPQNALQIILTYDTHKTNLLRRG